MSFLIPWFSAPGILETEFVLTTSGGTTEYRFTQSFLNNTELTRAAFRFELGFGTGGNFRYMAVRRYARIRLVRRTLDASFSAFPLTTDDMKALTWSGSNAAAFAFLSVFRTSWRAQIRAV